MTEIFKEWGRSDEEASALLKTVKNPVAALRDLEPGGLKGSPGPRASTGRKRQIPASSSTSRSAPPKGAPPPSSPVAGVGGGGSRRRLPGATAEGQGEAFHYEIHPETQSPEVVHGRSSRTTTPPVRPNDQQVQQQMQRRDTLSGDPGSARVPGKRVDTANRIQGPPTTTPPTKTPPKKQPSTDLQDPHGNLTPDGKEWIKDNFPTVRHPIQPDPHRIVKVDPKTLSDIELNEAYRKSPDLIERLVITEMRAYWAERAVKPTDFLYSNPKGSLDKFATQLESRAKAAGLAVDRSALKKTGAQFIDAHDDLRKEWNKTAIEIDEKLDKLRKSREARGTPAARTKKSDYEKALEKQRDELDKFERGIVGNKQPDSVEVLLGQSEVFVWDVTQQGSSAFHNFKTKFYGRVVEDLLGGKVKVKSAEYRAAHIQKEL